MGLVFFVVLECICKFECNGVLYGYEVCFDFEVMGFGMLVFLFVCVVCCLVEFGMVVKFVVIFEVFEVYYVVGEDCFLLKVCILFMCGLYCIFIDEFNVIGGIELIKFIIVFEIVKEMGKLFFFLFDEFDFDDFGFDGFDFDFEDDG